MDTTAKHFGLVGRSLGHSFSKSWFENKFRELGLQGYTYSNFEIANIYQLRDVMDQHPDLAGLNVTVPYKESVLPLLDALSPEVETIGAVNCIRIRNGVLTGFNTDAYGFAQSIKPFLDNTHERALVLGTGGASKAVAYALNQIGVDVLTVSRSGDKGQLTYEQINEHVMRACRLIVNTTPLGMTPDSDSCPALPYHLFSANHLAYDLVYNPAETVFMQQARAHGATAMNGLSMLQLQAEKNWELWTAL